MIPFFCTRLRGFAFPSSFLPPCRSTLHPTPILLVCLPTAPGTAFSFSALRCGGNKSRSYLKKAILSDVGYDLIVTHAHWPSRAHILLSLYEIGSFLPLEFRFSKMAQFKQSSACAYASKAWLTCTPPTTITIDWAC